MCKLWPPSRHSNTRADRLYSKNVDSYQADKAAAPSAHTDMGQAVLGAQSRWGPALEGTKVQGTV